MIPSTGLGFPLAEHPAAVFFAAALLLVPLIVTLTTGLKRNWTSLTVAGLALMMVGLLIHYFPQSVDDTFITLRYAENFAAGEGLCFNPGERVEGFSNPLWMILLSGFAAIGLNQLVAGDYALPLTAKLLGVVCLMLNFILVARWGLRGSTGERYPWVVLASLGWFVAAGANIIWSACGLETALHALLLSLLVIGWGDLNDLPVIPKRPVQVILSIVLLVLSRPEGALFGVAALGLWWWGARSNESRRPLGAAATLLVTIAIVTLFRAMYFGDWLPNTFRAKVSANVLFQLQHGLQYVAAALLATGGAVWLFVFRARANIIQLILFAQALFIFAVGGDWMPGFRFWACVIPVAAMGLMVVLAKRTEYSPLIPPTKWGENRIAQVHAALLVLTLTAMQAVAFDRVVYWQSDYFVSGFRRLDLFPSRVYYDVARELRDIVKPGQVLAVGEAGLIPYYSRARTLDYFGLTDRRIAAHEGLIHVQTTPTSILERTPDFILLGPVGSDLHGNLTFHLPIVADLLATPRFQAEYREKMRRSFFVLYERVQT